MSVSPNFASSTLEYGNYEFEKYGYTPIPSYSINGGRLSGIQYSSNLPWSNKNVSYEENIQRFNYINGLNNINETPTEALFQYSGNIRPGNHYQNMPGVVNPSNKHSMQCIDNNKIQEIAIQRGDPKINIKDVKGYDKNINFARW
jgi:hypothetical protein